MAAEALLVAVGGDPHDHRVPVLAVREELQGGTFATDLVGRVVQVGQILDLGYREHPRDPGAEGEAENGLFVEDRVEHPEGSGLFEKAAGHTVYATLAGDVLAEDHGLGVLGEDVAQRRVDRSGEGERLSVLLRREPGDPGGDGRGRLGNSTKYRLHHRLRAGELRQLTDLL